MKTVNSWITLEEYAALSRAAEREGLSVVGKSGVGKLITAMVRERAKKEMGEHPHFHQDDGILVGLPS